MDVVLVNMPFGPLATPSLGLSILAAQLKEINITVKVEYFNIKFAQILGEREYKYFCDGYPVTHALFAEWVFSRIFNSQDTTSEYVEKVLLPELVEGHSPPGYKSFKKQEIIQLIDEVANISIPFFEECLTTILSDKPKVVGFTSTFQQHVSSLMLARMIKKSSPDVIVVLGGANCDGEMGIETLKNHIFIDAIIQGEGENVFPVFVQSVLDGNPNYNISGIISNKQEAEILKTTEKVILPSQLVNLDGIPYPDFDDFVAAWESRKVEEGSPVYAALLFETARGCWWGQKNHCTFCGLNGDGMAFRSKNPTRAFKELKYLTEKYHNSEVVVVDNILDMKYFSTFIPMLQNSELDVDLFWEVKANLNYQHLKSLKDAGITSIQPGIESFSNSVLKLMNKGVTAIQNVQFLKWCDELNIHAVWNILYGFSLESPEDYILQAELIPKLVHLEAPSGYFPIRLDRYSPNFNQAEKYGFFDVEPMPAYYYVYPELEASQVYNMAYFFKHRELDSKKVSMYTESLRLELRRWKTSSSQALLIHIDDGSEIIIIDTRPKFLEKNIYKLDGLESLLYRFCESVQTLQAIYSNFTADRFSREELDVSVHKLIDLGYIINIDGKFLSLGINIDKKVLSDEQGLILENMFNSFQTRSAI